MPQDPYFWDQRTVADLLGHREYTGCTVNFKTYANSIWDKKTRRNPAEKRAVFHNTQQAIIAPEVFEKVQ